MAGEYLAAPLPRDNPQTKQLLALADLGDRDVHTALDVIDWGRAGRRRASLSPNYGAYKTCAPSAMSATRQSSDMSVELKVVDARDDRGS